MSTHFHGRRRGIVLIMVTFAMFLLCGMLGLVVDLGWSYFVRKSAQAAADAAAIAAVNAARDAAGELADYACGVKAQCEATPRYCSEIGGGNLKAACDYAQLHGFTDSADGRQRVSVQAYDRSGLPTVMESCGQAGATVAHAPTSGCVDTHYWVTVRVQERIPQLFSAMLGNVEGTVSARGTAGIAQIMIQGSLILINREMDPWKPHLEDGIDLYVGGTPEVIVPGGILIASTAHGPGVPQDPWAGFISGSGVVNTVDSPTVFRGLGHEAISGGGSWLGNKTYGGDAEFDDPMRGKGQPPLTSTVLPPKGIMGGTLDPARDCGGGDCPSALYYATGPDPGCQKGSCPAIATGAPIVIGSEVTFNGGAFGDFYFFGGVQIGQAAVHFGPGRYGLFGVQNPARDPLFNSDNMAQLLSTSANDAGRMFILSDTGYPDLGRQLSAIPETKVWGGAGKDQLFFSKSSIKSGNNADSRVELYGLNKDLLPVNETALKEHFNSVVVWQDQRNSYVRYTPSGRVDESCGGLNSPCAGGARPPSDSPQLEIWATPYAHFEGTIYQPRGAWTVLQAAGDYTGPLRIISGAMELQGSGRLTLTGGSQPVIRFTTALIE